MASEFTGGGDPGRAADAEVAGGAARDRTADDVDALLPGANGTGEGGASVGTGTRSAAPLSGGRLALESATPATPTPIVIATSASAPR